MPICEIRIAVLLYINFSAIYDIQPLLQSADSLALKVVDRTSYHFLLIPYFFYSRRLYFEFASE